MRTFATRFFRFALAALALAAPSFATEDKDNATPTGWAGYYNLTQADIVAKAGQGLRPVDLRVQSTSPLRYTAAFVSNSGTYARTWWHYYDVSGPQLTTHLSDNNARLICLDAYDNGSGSARFAAVMVSNTGAQQKGWWWTYNAQVSDISSLASSKTARPFLLREYKLGASTYYATVMISNTGADQKGWWHYYGTNFAGIGTHLSNTGGRLYDICASSAAGTYDILIVSGGTPKSWGLINTTEDFINDYRGNTGSRPMVVEPLGGGKFNAILINNSNALTTEISALMRGLTDGNVSVFLKRANGSELAGLNEDRRGVVASMFKTLHHVHAMRQVSTGADSLAANLVVYTGLNGSCPDNTLPVVETLAQTLRAMMENSDNARTEAVRARYGTAAINATAATLGMTNTLLQHKLGCCSSPLSYMSLRDLGRIHESVINGWLGAQRGNFYDLMLESLSGYAAGELDNVVDQEAVATGLSAAQKTAFKGAMVLAYKAGSLTCGGYHKTWGGYIALPFYTNAGIVLQEYVTAAGVDYASDDAASSAAVRAGASEVMRDEIHAAMLSWKDHIAGYFTSLGAGCKGTNNQTPSHNGLAISGEPNVGTSIQWRLTQAKANSPGALLVGASKTKWNTTNLPLSLAFAGMAGCTLYTSIDVNVPIATTALGGAGVGVAIPNVSALIGGHAFSQYLVLDPGANAAGVVFSNAVDTLIGGQL